MERELRLILDKLNDVDISKTYKQFMSYNVDGMVEYIGLALPSSLSSESRWSIRKLTYSGTNLIEINFAGGSNEMVFIWDNRSNYSYS